MFEHLKKIFSPIQKEPDELTVKLSDAVVRNREAAHELESLIKELLDRNKKIGQSFADRGVYPFHDKV